MRFRRLGWWAAPCALASLLVLTARAAPIIPEAGPLPPDLEVTADRAELRWSRTGRLLGHLHAGATIDGLTAREGWTRVSVRGWMWRASLEARGDQWRVTPERENLRVNPNGRILGTLERGVEVHRTGTEGRWYEVELVGWVDGDAVRPTDAEEPAETDSPVPDATAERVVEPEPEPPPAPSSGLPAGRLTGRTDLRAVPGGRTVTALPAGLVLRPVETRGGWTRVLVEGWVPSRAVRAGASEQGAPAAVALAPEQFVGRSVTWTLEHVALQRADQWRSDFEPGETFALARVPGEEGRYVYLAIPDRLIPAFSELGPFETIRVEGRVRTGRSELTGNPIVAVARLLP